MTKNRKYNEIAMKRLYIAFSGSKLKHAINVVRDHIDGDYIIFNMLISKMLKACEIEEERKRLNSRLIKTLKYNGKVIPWITYRTMLDMVRL